MQVVVDRLLFGSVEIFLDIFCRNSYFFSFYLSIAFGRTLRTCYGAYGDASVFFSCLSGI